jgi:hypothetical protein
MFEGGTAVAFRPTRACGPGRPCLSRTRGRFSEALLDNACRRLSREEPDALDWALPDEPLDVLGLDQVQPFFLLLRAPA